MEDKKPVDLNSEETETKYVKDPYADVDAKNDGEDYEEYEEEYVPVNPFEEETPLSEAKYSINLGEYESAFIEFQKKFVYPRNWMMTVVFVIMMGVYGYQIYNDPRETFRWFVLFLCVLLIGGIWWNTKTTRKKLMKSISELKDDTYITKLYENGVTIQLCVSSGEEIYPTPIVFGEARPVVIDKEDMFVLIIRKTMFYVIPKKELSEETIKLFAEKFEEKLEKDYIRK